MGTSSNTWLSAGGGLEAGVFVAILRVARLLLLLALSLALRCETEFLMVRKAERAAEGLST